MLYSSRLCTCGYVGFLVKLQTYDKDNISPAVIEKIKPYMDNPDFEPEVVKKASKAAFGLVSWVRAMEAYDRCCSILYLLGRHSWSARLCFACAPCKVVTDPVLGCGLLASIMLCLQGTCFACLPWRLMTGDVLDHALLKRSCFACEGHASFVGAMLCLPRVMEPNGVLCCAGQWYT